MVAEAKPPKRPEIQSMKRGLCFGVKRPLSEGYAKEVLVWETRFSMERFN